MASRFLIVSKDELLAVNEEAAPTNTKKETKFALLAFRSVEKNFLTEFACNKIIKLISETLSIAT